MVDRVLDDIFFPLVSVHVGDEWRAGKHMLQTPHVDIKSDPHLKPICTSPSFSLCHLCPLSAYHVHYLILSVALVSGGGREPKHPFYEEMEPQSS